MPGLYQNQMVWNIVNCCKSGAHPNMFRTLLIKPTTLLKNTSLRFISSSILFATELSVPSPCTLTVACILDGSPLDDGDFCVLDDDVAMDGDESILDDDTAE